MFLIQVLLPLYDNSGKAFESARFQQVREELSRRYGGLTVYSQSPAEGLWQDNGEQAVHDELILFEVMTSELERQWWSAYRRQLEQRFEQNEIVVRAQEIVRL
jgi:hypothetical protein